MTSSRPSPAVLQAGELAKSYEPTTVERGLYDWWDDREYFAPAAENGQEPFVVVMPPPNVTGVLHVGHALFVALEDIMVRWNRMMGRPTLWIPGADHAGIAGQMVVERALAAEGISRHDLGREKFIERMWEYMDALRPRIREQMKALGASADWSRFTFTMDPGPARAVRHAFKHLYDRGLIYRGERIISWCPNDRTALSDLEVTHKDHDSHLWSIVYPVDGENERIEVATTRPETMLGDTGVAVHPEDQRYQHLIGKQVRLPLVDRLIPIVADEHVDMAFGTGAVKVTPAHDPNDFDIAQRTGLPALAVMNLDGTLNSEAGPFEGMSMTEGREAVVAALEERGYLAGIEPHQHSVGHCERCDAVVEPLLSKQWFIRMEPLAKPALEAAYSGEVTFVPERYRGVYTNWMENVHDWCISRQLWWGHQIPIWYCDSCDETIASVEESVDTCPACGGAVRQDPDVLDTWFSSGLWPFSTLGWPDSSEDLARFYPGHVMETGYEIIFLWVSRMIFFGIEIMDEVPFHTVYLHGIVRDDLGQKMSKTKGNVIDPLEVSAEYGADALRYALVTQASPGNDSRLSLQKVEAGRNFGTKLWNMTRFALRSFEREVIDTDVHGPVRPTDDLTIIDRWILSRLDAVTVDVTSLMERHLYGEAGRQIADFLWNEMADWYIEAAKVRLRQGDAAAKVVGKVNAYVLERALRLLHPFMPFITETLWQHLPHTGDSIMVAPWPVPGERDEASERHVGAMMELVRGVRNARTEAGVEPARWIAATVYPGLHLEAFEQLRGEIGFLARIEDDRLSFAGGKPDTSGRTVTVVAGDVMASLPLEGMVDLGVEEARLRKELEEARAEKVRAERQLSNSSFVSRAPEHVVRVQHERLQRSQEQIAVIEQRLAMLGDA